MKRALYSGFLCGVLLDGKETSNFVVDSVVSHTKFSALGSAVPAQSSQVSHIERESHVFRYNHTRSR